MSLKGKRALVTGGGSGAGVAIARGLAEAGVEVVIAGRRREALEAAAAVAPGLRPITADVTDEASVKSLIREAGSLDIVIANAGAAASERFERTTLAQWNEILAVNLTGVFLTLREGLAQMQGWGRLIAIASTAGVRGWPYIAPYAASKHGVVGLVRSVALEVAKRPITVNALCPGYLDTEMTSRSVAAISAKTGRNAEEARKMLEAHNPQGRLFSPAEVASAALWLCSPGSEGVNGQTIVISGGEV